MLVGTRVIFITFITLQGWHSHDEQFHFSYIRKSFFRSGAGLCMNMTLGGTVAGCAVASVAICIEPQLCVQALRPR